MIEWRHMSEFAYAETRNRATRYVWYAHSQQQRIDECTSDHVATEFTFSFSPVPVYMQRVSSHCQHAKQVVFRVRYRLAWPVVVDVARLVVFEITAESSFTCRENTRHVRSQL